MIDTHAHMSSPLFTDDLPHVLQRAEVCGVKTIVCVSESAADALRVLNLCSHHRDILTPAIGIHPEHASTLSKAQLCEELESVSPLIKNSPVHVLGEVGLDFTPRVLSHASAPNIAKELQKTAFQHFIQMSQQLHLPLSVHSRGAGHYALSEILAANRNAPLVAVMHAFDGRAAYAENALQDMPEGLYFSVPPSIVRSKGTMKLVRRVPLNRLLLESDAPALPTIVGERNEPAQIVKALEMIAGLKAIDIETARGCIAQNCRSVFPGLVSSGS